MVYSMYNLSSLINVDEMFTALFLEKNNDNMFYATAICYQWSCTKLGNKIDQTKRVMARDSPQRQLSTGKFTSSVRNESSFDEAGKPGTKQWLELKGMQENGIILALEA